MADSQQLRYNNYQDNENDDNYATEDSNPPQLAGDIRVRIYRLFGYRRR